ncbi:hypothetical protein CLU79DRAFT_774675 [Phycomyces nitens]|nr:hypothetical protein CLU79DRAFT_774675 [Phycomyces nitens]
MKVESNKPGLPFLSILAIFFFSAMSTSAEDSVDVHAPASTYYTTGDNSSTGNRLRTLTVSGVQG